MTRYAITVTYPDGDKQEYFANFAGLEMAYQDAFTRVLPQVPKGTLVYAKGQDGDFQLEARG